MDDGFIVDDIGCVGYWLRHRSDPSGLPDVSTGDAVRPMR